MSRGSPALPQENGTDAHDQQTGAPAFAGVATMGSLRRRHRGGGAWSSAALIGFGGLPRRGAAARSHGGAAAPRAGSDRMSAPPRPRRPVAAPRSTAKHAVRRRVGAATVPHARPRPRGGLRSGAPPRRGLRTPRPRTVAACAARQLPAPRRRRGERTAAAFRARRRARPGAAGRAGCDGGRGGRRPAGEPAGCRRRRCGGRRPRLRTVERAVDAVGATLRRCGPLTGFQHLGRRQGP